MMTQVQWRGVFPALTTKFTAADEIDWDAMGQHLDVGLKFAQQIKLVEALMGVGSAKVRAPRLQLTEAEASRVEKILADALEQRPEM